MKDIYLLSFSYPTNIIICNNIKQFFYNKNNYITGNELLFLQKLIQEQNKVKTIDELINIIAKQFEKTDDEVIIKRKIESLNNTLEKFKEKNIIQIMKKGNINDIEWKYLLTRLNAISIHSNLGRNEGIHKNIINRDIIENEKYQLINHYITKNAFEIKENILNVDLEDYLLFVAIESSSNLLEVFNQYKTLMLSLHYEIIQNENEIFYNRFMTLLIKYYKHLKLIEKEVN